MGLLEIRDEKNQHNLNKINILVNDGLMLLCKDVFIICATLHFIMQGKVFLRPQTWQAIGFLLSYRFVANKS
jgi:hypothetical protein